MQAAPLAVMAAGDDGSGSPAAAEEGLPDSSLPVDGTGEVTDPDSAADETAPPQEQAADAAAEGTDAPEIVTAEDPEDQKFSGGEGTELKPYQIATTTDLVDLANAVNEGNGTLATAYYVLSGDIDLSGIPNWTPIGDGISAFTGNFTGTGHTISGLTISGLNVVTKTVIINETEVEKDYGYAGLFGVVMNATLEDIVLVPGNVPNTGIINATEGANVEGYSGAVVGYAYDSTLINLRNDGVSVDGGVQYMGGLVGQAAGTTIKNSYNGAAVRNQRSVSTNGYRHVGGIVGNIAGSTASSITGCYNAGAIGHRSDAAYAGGIVGSAGSVAISDCVNTGSVAGGSHTGGIASFLNGQQGTATIIRCINFGEVGTDSTSACVGGIAGQSLKNTNGGISNSVSAAANMGPFKSPMDSTTKANTKRILGNKVAGKLEKNYAFTNIKLDGKENSWSSPGAANLNGANKGQDELTAKSLWLGLGYSDSDTGLWTIPDGDFPYLKAFGKYADGTLPTLTGSGAVTLTGIALDKTSMRMVTGETVTLTPSPKPVTADVDFEKTNITWTLSGDDVVELLTAGTTQGGAPVKLTVKTTAKHGDSFTLTGTAKNAKGKTLTATFGGMVVKEAEGISLPKSITLKVGATRTLEPVAVPAGAQLPDDLEWRSNNETVATVDENGKVTALAPGYTSLVLNFSPFSGIPPVSVYVYLYVTPADSTGYTVGIKDSGGPISTWDATLGDTTNVTFESNFDYHYAEVVWSSSDERVVTVHDEGGVWNPEYAMNTPVIYYANNAALPFTLRANAPGAATVYATTADGLAVASVKVTVKAPEDPAPAFTVDQTSFTVVQNVTTELRITGTYADTPPLSEVMVDGVAIPSFTLKAQNGRYTLTKSLILPSGEIIVRHSSGTSIRIPVTAVPAPASAAGYTPLELAENKVTIHTLSDAKSAKVPLYINQASATDIVVPIGGTVRFTGADDTPQNRLFDIKSLENGALEVTYDSRGLNPNEKLKSSYSGNLEIKFGENVTIPIKGKLTIAVNQKPIKLAATPQTVNIFQDSALDGAARTVPVNITTEGVEVLEYRWAKTPPAFVDENKLPTAANPVITVKADAKKVSGTVKLEVKLAGWSPEAAFTLDVKVTRAYTPTAVKLKATSAKVLASDKSMGATLTLMPKSKKDSLAGLGVTKVDIATNTDLPGSVPPELAKKYSFDTQKTYPVQDDYKVESYNVRTGEIVLKAAKNNPGKGKLLLAVSVEGTADTVKLPVSVTPVTNTAKVSLKASKTSFTLNQNLSGGDSYDVVLTPSVAGIDPDKLDLKWEQLNAEKVTDILPSVQVMGNVVCFSAAEGVTPGKTWKYKVTAPGLYQKDKKDVPVSVTITVKTQKKEKPGEEKYTKVVPSVSVKGKVDLTTGAAATVTIKLTNTMQTLKDSAVEKIDILAPGGATINSDCFIFTRTGDSTWRLGLNYKKLASADILMGKYTLRMGPDAELSGGTKAASAAKDVVFTVQASKPKVTQSTKKVTLYKGTALDSKTVVITLPGNVPPLKTGDGSDPTKAGVILRGTGAAANYVVKPVNAKEGVYAITFKNAAAAKNATLTLELWAQGHRYEAGKPTTTIKVSVAAKTPAK